MCDILLETWCNDIYIDKQNKAISYVEVYLRGGIPNMKEKFYCSFGLIVQMAWMVKKARALKVMLSFVRFVNDISHIHLGLYFCNSKADLQQTNTMQLYGILQCSVVFRDLDL